MTRIRLLALLLLAFRGLTETIQARAESLPFRVETVVTGLEVPWGMAFAPEGRLLVTERPGRLRVVESGRLRGEPLAVLKEVVAHGEAGLMGLALHPEYAQNRWLYLCYTIRAGRDLTVRVMRFREEGTGLGDRTVILDSVPAASLHAGCRLRFGPDGRLYVTTGDATDRDLAQRLDSLVGKTLRLNPDGSIPADNPFQGRPGARPEIWSLGHRNAQGMDWHLPSGLMFQTEHGPSGFDGPTGGDEVNVIERGLNYGWPLISHRATRPGLVSPLLEFTPAIAPAGGSFYRGSLFPAWRDNFFFGTLRGARLMRVVLDPADPRRVVATESLLQGTYGRIRDVAGGPEGALYLATSNRDGRGRPAAEDDRILRLVPGR